MYSENLKKIRFELHLSAQKLADKIGVSKGSIQNYEGGARKPDYNFLYQLNTKLNVNINWLMTGEGEMFITNTKKAVSQFEQVKNDLAPFIKQLIEEEFKNRFP